MIEGTIQINGITTFKWYAENAGRLTPESEVFNYQVRADGRNGKGYPWVHDFTVCHRPKDGIEYLVYLIQRHISDYSHE